MASALPGDICVGQHSVCIIRAVKLNADCTPDTSADTAFITTGIITATASAELKEGTSLEPETGCGDIAWTYEVPDAIRRYNLTGELAFFDHELMEILFGGTLLVGATGTTFDGDTVGWAAPNYTDNPPPPLYVEFITKTAGQGVGECGNPGSPFPPYVGHIFGKARFTPGDRTFSSDAATVAFTGSNVANPNLADGPWNDYPATGDIPNSPYIQVDYGQDEYDAIADLAACGYQSIPT